jgi:hypothetical protein
MIMKVPKHEGVSKISSNSFEFFFFRFCVNFIIIIIMEIKKKKKKKKKGVVYQTSSYFSAWRPVANGKA